MRFTLTREEETSRFMIIAPIVSVGVVIEERGIEPIMYTTRFFALWCPDFRCKGALDRLAEREGWGPYDSVPAPGGGKNLAADGEVRRRTLEGFDFFFNKHRPLEDQPDAPVNIVDLFHVGCAAFGFDATEDEQVPVLLQAAERGRANLAAHLVERHPGWHFQLRTMLLTTQQLLELPPLALVT